MGTKDTYPDRPQRLRKRRTKLEKKLAYEKPVLRKVRLEVKTSVLAVCNSSIVPTPQGGIPNCHIPSCRN